MDEEYAKKMILRILLDVEHTNEISLKRKTCPLCGDHSAILLDDIQSGTQCEFVVYCYKEGKVLRSKITSEFETH